MREGGGATLKATNLDFVSSLGRILRHYCLKIAVSKLEYSYARMLEQIKINLFPSQALGGKMGTPAATLANMIPKDMKLSVPQTLARKTTTPIDADLLSFVRFWIELTARSK